MGEHLGHFTANISMFCCAMVLSFLYCWKLTLANIFAIPLSAAAFAIVGYSARGCAENEKRAYLRANEIVTEACQLIRTVFAFGGQEKEANKYEGQLPTSARMFTIRALVYGTGVFPFK